ncbi:hypothetical protein H5410_064248 [Solanum commersonii]|uniref:KIB1-4 beta-propeller domain-containing protein n=1 Tax=Solanum commersonii TaxID=4109 RepID=A0A9J5W0N2_SOLCO|nr:hypothetical protein H5410_064248 [Solanum commersonii]
MKLLQPFSRAQIQLPPRTSLIEYSEDESLDLICHSGNLEIFTRPKLILKDVVRSMISNTSTNSYMLTYDGVWVIDNHDQPRLLLKKNYNYETTYCPYYTRYYLVEGSGALLIVKQFCENGKVVGHIAGEYEFQVWQLDLINGEAK